jgi:hypothetical protein
LLLEGADIQSLLAQVRAEHGAGAKIVSADRIRAAGLLGMFSRQRYELTVEIDKLDGDTPAPAAVDGPTPDPTGSPSPGAAPYFRAGLPTATVAYQASLVDAGQPIQAPTGPTGPTGPAVLGRTGRPAPTSTADTNPADALVALVEDRERQQFRYATADGTAAITSAPNPAVPVSAEAAAFADVLANFSIPGWSAPEPFIPPAAAAPLELASAPRRRPVQRPILPADNALATLATDHLPTAMPADSVLIPPYRSTPLPTDAPLTAMLARLGVPAELSGRATGHDSYRAIVKILRLLPAPPAAPTEAGDVLLIVGEVDGAVATAHTVTTSLGLAKTNVLIASASFAWTHTSASQRLISGDQAAKRVAELRDRVDAPLIVAVAAPVDGSDAGLVRSVIDNVEATAIWGVVDATRKTADSARLLADIGRVDAIAVRAWALTGDPATVLQLGIPVALLDGQVPTPYLWADLLCRRLDEVMAP